MDYRDRHVIVTGGTGALGTALVAALVEAGATCHVPVMHAAEAERFPLRGHSAVELVDRLVDRGLVSRSRSPADRRHVLVHLTAHGEGELEKLAKCHLDELRNNGPALVEALEAVIRRNDGAN